ARLALRHPNATRPWQHVLDCINGYLLFAEALAEGRTQARALNFAPAAQERVSVAALADTMFRALGREPAWDHVPEPNSIEAEVLALDASAARAQLGWRSRLDVDAAARWTADWYRAHATGRD